MSEAPHNVEILEERWVDFYGDTIKAVLARVDGTVGVYVAVKMICDALEMNWSPQRARIKRNPVLDSVMIKMIMTARDNKRYAMECLPLEFLHGWMFGITLSQIKREDIRERLARYQRECYHVLSQAFQPVPELPGTTTELSTESPGAMTLAQVRDMALAIAQMADQQLALEGRVDETHTLATHAHGRLDKAAQVIGALQRRMGTVENRLNPGAAITEDQAAEISQRVRALAHLLSGKEKGKNHYQGVFGEIYRHFGVTSYTHIPLDRYLPFA
jgi:hypothetical protein